MNEDNEDETDDIIIVNDPKTILALWLCGLAKFFLTPGINAQTELLDFLVREWDSNEQWFHIGSHSLAIEVEDIYFLTRLSKKGARIQLTSHCGGGENTDYYVSQHYIWGSRKVSSGKIEINM